MSNRHYGIYGGQYVAETLMPTLFELESVYQREIQSPSFKEELEELLKNYVGRQTPLYYAKRLTDHCRGAQIYLKR